MISCTEFIPAYNELFKFLERRGGKQAVVDFWEHLSDRLLTNRLFFTLADRMAEIPGVV